MKLYLGGQIIEFEPIELDEDELKIWAAKWTWDAGLFGEVSVVRWPDEFHYYAQYGARHSEVEFASDLHSTPQEAFDLVIDEMRKYNDWLEMATAPNSPFLLMLSRKHAT